MYSNEERLKERCVRLAREIVCEANIFFTDIRYEEFLHNVYYIKGICYCEDLSERRMLSSKIEKAHYKNRIIVTLVGIGSGIANFDRNKKKINKIIATNVRYKRNKESIEITFSINPHKM